VNYASSVSIPKPNTAITAAGEGNRTSSGELAESDGCIVSSHNRDASGSEVEQTRCLVIAACQQAAAIGTKSCPINRTRVSTHSTMIKGRLLLLQKRVVQVFIVR
jgi:hypothetical protein